MTVIVGIIGIVGIWSFAAMLLCVPLLYSILSVAFNFVVMATVGFDNIASWVAIAISCIVAALFYYNYTIVT